MMGEKSFIFSTEKSEEGEKIPLKHNDEMNKVSAAE